MTAKTLIGQAAALFVLTAGLFYADPAFAQTGSGTIAGAVRDASGAVLPGVTVEVSSPALIEKTRTAQTDSSGLYKITELRPGTYEVTFTLTGFNTVKQSGIELTTGFAATVNADLRVGDIAETVTVTGETPIVDVQNSHQQVVMTRDVIDAIPTGKNFQNLGVLIPGVSVGPQATVQQDVGGGAGQALMTLFIHGGRDSDMQTHLDGMSVQSFTSVARSAQALSEGMFQEVAFDVSANSAEIEAGGVRVNLIPRDGGNTLSGSFSASGAITGLQANNLTDSLKQMGITDINPVKRLWDVGPTVGGPIVRDRLWIVGSYKETRADTYLANSYEAVDPAAWTYVADKSKRAHSDIWTREGSARLTWQAGSKNKIGAFVSRNQVCQCELFTFFNNARMEATTQATLANWIGQATWTAPLTSRLLLDFGVSTAPAHQMFDPQPNATAARIIDNGLGFAYRGPQNNSDTNTTIWNERGSVSYVTGSHAFKVGFLAIEGHNNSLNRTLGNVRYDALNGVPLDVIYFGTPITVENDVNANIGIFAQDQWTLHHLTAGLGLRFDYFRSGFPDQFAGPTEFVRTSRSFAAQDAVSWKDLSPRIGLSYDVFGNGKTAVKGSVNRYVLQQGVNMAASINPMGNNNSNTRIWNDNGDRIVQGDPFNDAANLELGPSLNLNFGRPVVTYSYDPDLAKGFGVRPANWEFTAAIQHELLPRVSANVTFVRRIYTNFVVNDNTAITSADYDSYCVTVPEDSRLSTSGQRLCGVMNLKPASVSAAASGSIVGRRDSFFGNMTEHWNGADIAITARLPKLVLQGGLSTGRTSLNVCDMMRNAPENYFSVPALPVPVPTSPGLPLGNANAQPSIPLDFCDNRTPFLNNVKLVGSYTFPYAISFAATLQSLPGPQLIANGTYTNAQVLPLLGRALSQGTSQTVNLIQPGTQYGDRLNQLDLRVSKRFQLARVRAQGILDVYNSTNASPVTAMNTAYGATTGAARGAAFIPTQVLAPRIVKVGVQLTF